jgi:hypothetical protein
MTWLTTLRSEEDFETWLDEDYDSGDLGFEVYQYGETYYVGAHVGDEYVSKGMTISRLMMMVHLHREDFIPVPAEDLISHVRGRPCAVFEQGGRFYFKNQISPGHRKFLIDDDSIKAVLLRVEDCYLFCTDEGVVAMQDLYNLSSELRRVFP